VSSCWAAAREPTGPRVSFPLLLKRTAVAAVRNTVNSPPATPAVDGAHSSHIPETSAPEMEAGIDRGKIRFIMSS
jgi:hypothetical protein